MTSAEARRRAVSMAEGGAWSPYAIAAYLTRNEFPVSEWTVRRWVDPAYADRERDRNRERSRRRMRQLRATLTRVRILDAEALMARMQSLRAAGLSYAAVARVVNLDHGCGLTDDEVRNALIYDRPPRRFTAETRVAA